MKLFTTGQIRRWDEATILEERIQSVDLMERAAKACAESILGLNPGKVPVHIFCGPGNNGGDGLAITRLLQGYDFQVHGYLLALSAEPSQDCQTNLDRLKKENIPVTYIRNPPDLPSFSSNTLIIDALFGTGLNKPLHGLAATVVQFLNDQPATRIAIDIPSGLMSDSPTQQGNAIFKADHTLSFQVYKRSFLFADSEAFTGTIHIMDIGLSKRFYQEEPCSWEMTEAGVIRQLIHPRKLFSHKGNFGHAALVAGSKGMMGAAVMAAGACLQSGTGKLTCYVPSTGYEIMQTARPEAMCRVTGNNEIGELEGTDSFSALGIGPGLGQADSLPQALQQLFEKPPARLVMDADALNVLENNEALLKRIPEDTLITPHPKEFDRLAGPSGDDWERLDKAIRLSARHSLFIVLKGHFSRIVCPDGMVYFNPTGNPGMAKGGSGDVLTGLLTGLLAQGYQPREAALIGTYLHGLAGDLAANLKTTRGMTALDILDQIPHAWALAESA